MTSGPISFPKVVKIIGIIPKFHFFQKNLKTCCSQKKQVHRQGTIAQFWNYIQSEWHTHATQVPQIIINTFWFLYHTMGLAINIGLTRRETDITDNHCSEDKWYFPMGICVMSTKFRNLNFKLKKNIYIYLYIY